MKANKLMVGDLLKWKEQPGFNDEDRNMVLRVKNIFDDSIKIDGRFELYHISLFEPIPLTPEILEKNGFHYDGASFWYEDFRIVLSTSKGVSLVCGRQKRFEFVHELQHTLRLCGIEKEIIL